jgi:hypothetical protein
MTGGAMEVWWVPILGVLLILIVKFFSFTNDFGRKSRLHEDSDPEIAKALRDVQNQIEQGRGYYFH